MSGLIFKEDAVIDVQKVPVTLRRSSREWLDFLRRIEDGRAYKTTPKELGTSASNLRSIVAHYVKKGDLRGYRVVQRQGRKKREVIVYIVHDESGNGGKR